MRRIDSHQHFWSYDAAQYPWIQPGSALHRSFLPADLQPLLEKAGFDGCVAVQARQSLEETRWLLKLAAENKFIAGVVGWVDLRSPSVDDDLAQFMGEKKLSGVRHVVQDEPDDRFMLREDFQRGIEALHGFGLAYDILIYPRQLPAAIALARRFPHQPFVLDHLAKPSIRDQKLEPWRAQIRELAQSRNVLCKISGLVTEARLKAWQPDDFRPFLDAVWEAFGEDRLMIGSDWPVCLLSAEYGEAMKLAQDFLAQFPPAAREKVLGGNAARFYQLKP